MIQSILSIPSPSVRCISPSAIRHSDLEEPTQPVSAPSPRDLPPVHAVAAHPELASLGERLGHEAVVRAVRAVLEDARDRILRGEFDGAAVDIGSLARRAAEFLRNDRPGLRPVLNATGVLLHTGLGRAPLAAEAVEAVAAVARGYCNLEFDLESGDRGRRTTAVADLLKRLTGAEAATVVNNNAGATVLALRALASGREVVVSRGQLIEIGGSFRLPEIFEVSGARLREVGTTNRTRLSDYERAIGPETAALLRVHPSNYRVIGFTESVGIAELAALARSRGLKAIDDIGSGALGPGRPPGVESEPTAAEGLAAGADLVLGSGDKLLGGPQCGLLLGTREAVGRAQSDPLMRALRVDKMTLAALEATLRLALDPALAARRIPLWAFLTATTEAIRDRAGRLADALRSDPGLNASVVEATAFLGGGAVPAEPIPTSAVRVEPPLPPPWTSESQWARALRLGDPPVVARVQGGAVLFDLRALDPADDDRLLDAVRRATRPGGSPAEGA
jgi:L-seryl-tRNA(Ser) seleniumtransferase